MLKLETQFALAVKGNFEYELGGLQFAKRKKGFNVLYDSWLTSDGSIFERQEYLVHSIPDVQCSHKKSCTLPYPVQRFSCTLQYP